LHEVDAILNLSIQDQYGRFKELFEKYGHVIATVLTIGGQLYHTDMRERKGSVDEIQHKEERKQEFRAAVNQVAVPAKVLMEAGVGTGTGTKNEAKSRDDDNRQTMNTTFQATGGETVLCQDPSKWVLTVENFLNWRVINIEKTIPLYKIVDKERQCKIESVLYQHERKTIVSDNKLMRNDTRLSTHKIPPRIVLTPLPITGIEIVSKISGKPEGYQCIEKGKYLNRFFTRTFFVDIE
jgi:hypothetical protein